MGELGGDDGDPIGLAQTQRGSGREHEGDAAEELVPGAQVRRFEVLSKVGAGAMGTVYAAYDPELDRRVALKLIRTRATAEDDTLQGRRRLVREAKAMARLSHPNVITVYDVGTIDREVFVAMEYVEGGTLRQWLAREHRSVDEILDIFCQAGAGLAAAHRAELVHRDFKPDNVLVGDDGRVCVTDFGVARAVDAGGEESESAGARLPADLSPDALHTPLTKTGSLVGTPRYMAPEQHAGKPTEPRTDQFSFCVALWEAVYGRLPFDGANLPELAHNVMDGRIAEPPARVDVPAALAGALRRGLSPRIEDRFASMDDLLRELRPAERAPKKLWLAVAAVAVAALGAGAFAVTRGSAPERSICDGGEQHLRGVWDDARRAAVRDRFGSVAPQLGGELADRVIARMDTYTADWSAAFRDACEATRVRGEQSETGMDLRMACLRERLDRVTALSNLYAKADASTLESAAQAAWELPELASCADVLALRDAVAPPADPAAAARVQQLRTSLAQVQALEDAGKYAEGLALARQLATDADATDYDPLRAEVLLSLGTLQADLGEYAGAEQSLAESFWKAMGSKHDRVAASAAIEVVRVIDLHKETSEEQLTWIGHARAAVKRVGLGGAADAALEKILGDVATRHGDYDEAQQHFARAIELGEKLHGGDHPRLAAAVSGLGSVLEARGELDAAIEHQRRALAILTAALGETHPKTAAVLNSIGTLLSKKGQYDDARASYERALAVYEKTLGEQHAKTGSVVNNLGIVAYFQGKYEDALAFHQRGLEIRLVALGPKHTDVAGSYNNLGLVLVPLGRLDEAAEAYRHALAIREEIFGPDHPMLAYELNNLGRVYLDQGKLDEALAQHRRALALQERALSPEHHDVGNTVLAIGAVYLKQGKLARARAHFDRARTIWEAAFGADHPHVAHAWGNLGLVATELEDWDGAIEASSRARDIFEKAFGPEHPNAAFATVDIARAHLGKSDAGRALELSQAALAALEKALGPDNPDLSVALVCIGRAHLASDQPKLAIAPLERAVKLHESSSGDPADLEEARFALAQALWHSGADKRRAIELARAANHSPIADRWLSSAGDD